MKRDFLKIYSAYLPYELELNIENEIETDADEIINIVKNG